MQKEDSEHTSRRPPPRGNGAPGDKEAAVRRGGDPSAQPPPSKRSKREEGSAAAAQEATEEAAEEGRSREPNPGEGRDRCTPLWPLFCRRHCRAPVPLATLESSCSPDDSAFAVVSGRRGNGEVMDALFDSDSDGEAYDFEEDDI